MKTICFTILFLISSSNFSNVNMDEDISIVGINFLLHTESSIKSSFSSKNSEMMAFKSKVCATGIVNSSEYGDFEATVCITGPSNSSLANKLRTAIAELRAAFK